MSQEVFLARKVGDLGGASSELRAALLFLFGVCLFGTWEELMFVGSALPHLDIGVSRHLVYFLSKATSLGICAAFPVTFGGIHSKKLSYVASALLMVASTVLMMLGIDSGDAVPVMLASVLGGLGAGLAVLLWLEQCGRVSAIIPMAGYLVYRLFSPLLMVLCYDLTGTMFWAVSVGLAVLAPAFFFAAHGAIDGTTAASESDLPPKPWHIGAIVWVQCFSFAFWEPTLGNEVFAAGSHTATASILVAAAALVAVIVRMDKRDLLVGFRFVLPLFAVAFLLMPRSLPQAVGLSNFASAGFCTVSVFLVLSVLAGSCGGDRGQVRRLFATVYAVRYLCVALGELSFIAVSQNLSPENVEIAFSLVAAATMAVLVMLLPDRRTLYKNWKIGVNQEEEPATRESFDNQVHSFALVNGLTPREETVFSMLVSGCSVAEIQDKLVLSKDTVRTHRRNIYSKCLVHSHEELKDSFKSWTDNS